MREKRLPKQSGKVSKIVNKCKVPWVSKLWGVVSVRWSTHIFYIACIYIHICSCIPHAFGYWAHITHRYRYPCISRCIYEYSNLNHRFITHMSIYVYDVLNYILIIHICSLVHTHIHICVSMCQFTCAFCNSESLKWPTTKSIPLCPGRRAYSKQSLSSSIPLRVSIPLIYYTLWKERSFLVLLRSPNALNISKAI